MLRVLFVLLAVLAAMPLEVDVSVFLNATPSYAAVVRVYGKRIRLGGLIRLDPKSFLKKRKNGRLLRAYMRALLPVFKKACTHAAASCRVGVPDAALTALSAGAVRAALGACRALLPVRARVTADFQSPGFALAARCIFSLRGGDIMGAGVRALWREARSGRREEKKDGSTTH